jgi:hypothetical protein
MATRIERKMPSGSPDTWQPFIVRMKIDFSQFTFANADILVGPELEPGTMPIRLFGVCLEAGNTNSGNVKIGFTGDDDAWEASQVLNVDQGAGLVEEYTLAGDTAVTPVDSSTPKRSLLVTATAAQSVTSGVFEIVMVCIKTGYGMI